MEDVIGFRSHEGIAFNDMRESGPGQRLPFVGIEVRVCRLEPEAITVPQPNELVAQNVIDQLTDLRARDVIFGQSPDPRIDQLNVVVICLLQIATRPPIG